MKKLSYYLSAALLGAAVLFTSCSKKTDDPVPTSTIVAKTYTSTMTSTNMGNTGAANVIATVSTADGIAKIRLDVSGTNPLDKIYVMLSRDNGPFEAVSYTSSIVNAAGETFTANSSAYTLDVPNLSSFIVDLPVTIRTAGVTDVYQIWITNGAGAFNKPTKNRDLGIANVILKYTTSTAATFATATVDLGSQTTDDFGSLLVTTGQVAALNTTDYNDAPGSADIRLITLTGGKKDNGSTVLYFYSPADATDANPPVSGSTVLAPVGSKTTDIELYSGTDFATITAANLEALTLTSGSSVTTALVAGNVYKFETQDGKKGLVKVNTITTATPVAGETVARNINVTVKVLN